MTRHRDVGGLRLREIGPRSAPTAIWLHGLGESGLGFEPVLGRPELAGWRHWAVDLPGYGRSLPARPVPDLVSLAGALARWLEGLGAELGGQPVVVVGHSMGGVIGILLCEACPERIRGFVNVEGNVGPDDCTLSRRAAAWSCERFLAEGFDRLGEEVFAQAAEVPALRSYYPSLRFADPATYHRHSLDLMELSAREELAQRQSRLALPSVYLYGDPGGTGARSRALLDAAGVEVTAIRDAGHWPFVDRPGAFASAAGDLLARFP